MITGIKFKKLYSLEVVTEIQDSEHFERDLVMAASLEEDLFNPLPPGLTGL